MTNVHDVYAEKRRSRAGPIIGLTIVCLLLIGIMVAMIMNIHGSISWPAGELKFGFWPQATSAETQVATNATVAVPAAIATPDADVQPVDEASQDAQQSETQPPPSATPPAESPTTAPAESEPAPAQ